jgi:FkbM family methyltransferase
MNESKLHILANTLKCSYVAISKQKYDELKEYWNISFDYMFGINHVFKSEYYIFEEIFFNEIYKFNTELKQFKIIDIGSNIGLSIKYFKKLYPECSIVGYEPIATTYFKLKDNVKDLNNVEVHQLAVSNRNGEATIYFNPDYCGANSLYNDKAIEKLSYSSKVNLIDANEIVNEPIEVLKIDCEGEEYNIIKRLDESLKLYLINQILMEIHFYCLNDELYILFDILRKNGFKVVNIMNCSKEAFTIHLIRC